MGIRNLMVFNLKYKKLLSGGSGFKIPGIKAPELPAAVYTAGSQAAFDLGCL